MCGIVGYIGHKQAGPILLDGLSKLEYRGYDSAGIAVRNGADQAVVVKAVGKLENLSNKTNGGYALSGECGIGHTRWATHGAPSLINAQPHVSGNCTGSGSGEVESEVVGVHNGIIENFQELKEKLIALNALLHIRNILGAPLKLKSHFRIVCQTAVSVFMLFLFCIFSGKIGIGYTLFYVFGIRSYDMHADIDAQIAVKVLFRDTVNKIT